MEQHKPTESERERLSQTWGDREREMLALCRVFHHIHLSTSEFRVIYRLHEGCNFLASYSALLETIITLNHHWISKITVIFDLEDGFSSQLGQSFYQGFLEAKPKVQIHLWNITHSISVHSDGKSNSQHEQLSVRVETRAPRCFLNELSRKFILNLLLNSTTLLCKNWHVYIDSFSLCLES